MRNILTARLVCILRRMAAAMALSAALAVSVAGVHA